MTKKVFVNSTYIKHEPYKYFPSSCIELFAFTFPDNKIVYCALFDENEYFYSNDIEIVDNLIKNDDNKALLQLNKVQLNYDLDFLVLIRRCISVYKTQRITDTFFNEIEKRPSGFVDFLFYLKADDYCKAMNQLSNKNKGNRIYKPICSYIETSCTAELLGIYTATFNNKKILLMGERHDATVARKRLNYKSIFLQMLFTIKDLSDYVIYYEENVYTPTKKRNIKQINVDGNLRHGEYNKLNINDQKILSTNVINYVMSENKVQKYIDDIMNIWPNADSKDSLTNSLLKLDRTIYMANVEKLREKYQSIDNNTKKIIFEHFNDMKSWSTSYLYDIIAITDIYHETNKNIIMFSGLMHSQSLTELFNEIGEANYIFESPLDLLSIINSKSVDLEERVDLRSAFHYITGVKLS